MADSPYLDTLQRLISKHDQEKPALSSLNSYYEGTQPLAYMHPELQRELEDRIKQVVVNWPRLVIDSVEERLDIEGFRMPGKPSSDSDSDGDGTPDDPFGADGELQRIWQANNLDEFSQQGHVDAMVMRRAFTVVSHNDQDASTPIISVESPLEMHAELDPATRTLREAVKRWKQFTDVGREYEMATLYATTGERVLFSKESGDWVQEDVVDLGLGKPPVNVLPNRPRLLHPLGCSDLDDITPISDAACKIATDMMVAAEFAAIPQRWVFGMGPEEFADPQTGQPLTSWQAIMGRIWANAKTGIEAGQFDAADLKNFHDTLNALARMTASLAGIPVHELGFVTENPPSADALRAGEIRRIKRAERKQRGFSGGWEATMRAALRLASGEKTDDPAWSRMETIWRDPATPTIAQKADAAVKLYAEQIVPLRQTREDLGYTAAQIDRMEDEDAKDPVNRLMRPAPPAPPDQSAMAGATGAVPNQ